MIRSNIYLYRFWFHLNSHKFDSNVRLPNPYDDFYFGGFPRSGNTYLSHLIRFIYPEIKFSSHLHQIAAIKLALKLDLQVLVIVRDPIESLSSLIASDYKETEFKIEEEVVKARLLYCKDYFYFIKRIKPQIRIIDFNQLLNDEEGCINNIISYLGLHFPNNLYENLENFKIKMRSLEMNKIISSSGKSGNLPNLKRNAIKEQVKVKLKEYSAINECELLYRELLS